MDLLDHIQANKGKKIHELITPETWHRGYSARRYCGAICAMCLGEWICTVYGNEKYSDLRPDFIQYGEYTIVDFNDKVAASFDEVLAKCKELDI